MLDGHSNSRPGETTRAAAALKLTGRVSLYAVGVGADPDMTALARVASGPRPPYLLRMAEHLPNDVTAVAGQLLDSICSQ